MSDSIRLVDEETHADFIQRLKTAEIIPPHAQPPIIIDINELRIEIRFHTPEQHEET